MAVLPAGSTKGGPSLYGGFLSAIAYSFFSISITLFNKALLTSYGFDSTITLTLLQGIFTILCLEFMKWRGYASYPDFNWKTAYAVLPLSLVFIAYVVVSLISLGRVNVPMFTALRRLTIIFVMIEEYFYFGSSSSKIRRPPQAPSSTAEWPLRPVPGGQPPLPPWGAHCSLRTYLLDWRVVNTMAY